MALLYNSTFDILPLKYSLTFVVPIVKLFAFGTLCPEPGVSPPIKTLFNQSCLFVPSNLATTLYHVLIDNDVLTAKSLPHQ